MSGEAEENARQALGSDPAEAAAILERGTPAEGRGDAALRVLCAWYYPARPSAPPDRLAPFLRLLGPFDQTVFLKVVLEQALFAGRDPGPDAVARAVAALDPHASAGAATWVECQTPEVVAALVGGLPDAVARWVALAAVSVQPTLAARFPEADRAGRLRAAIRRLDWAAAAALLPAPPLSTRDFVNARWVEDPPAAARAIEPLRTERPALAGARGLHTLAPLLAEGIVRESPLAACHALMPALLLEALDASSAAALFPDVLRIAGKMDERGWQLLGLSRREPLAQENAIRALARVDAGQARWVVESERRRRQPRLTAAVEAEEAAAKALDGHIVALERAARADDPAAIRSELRAVTEPAEHPATDEGRLLRIVRAVDAASNARLRELEPLLWIAFADAPAWVSRDLREAHLRVRHRAVAG